MRGSANARLAINKAGDVAIKGEKMLFLNLGDEARATEFLAQRVAQGLDGAAIRSFEVPTAYVKELLGRAVPESMARLPGASVILVDVTKTRTSVGLRASEFPALLRAIISGSGQ